MQKRALAYARVSTQGQVANTSLASQQAAITAFCVQNGYELIDAPYIDVDSGSKEDRQGLERLRARIKLKNFDFIIVSKIDRFTRDVLLGETVRKEIEENGGKLLSVNESIDTQNPMGIMFVQLLQIFSQYEKSQILWRLASGKKHTVSNKGGWLGGTVPLGYKALGTRDRPAGGKVEIEPTDAFVVRLALDMRKQGQSYQEIANELNSRGYKTRSKVTRRGNSVGGIPFDKTTIFRIIKRSEVYAGNKTINSSYTLNDCKPAQPKIE